MDLKKYYGYNKDKANDKGVWIECGEDAAVLCRYYNPSSTRVAAVHAKRTRKYRALINAKALPPEKDREIAIEIFVEASVINWRGIEVDGHEVAYSPEAAIKLFMEWPEFYADIASQAMEMKTFRDEDDAKN